MTEPQKGIRFVISPELVKGAAELGVTIYIGKNGELEWTLGTVDRDAEQS